MSQIPESARNFLLYAGELARRGYSGTVTVEYADGGVRNVNRTEEKSLDGKQLAEEVRRIKRDEGNRL